MCTLYDPGMLLFPENISSPSTQNDLLSADMAQHYVAYPNPYSCYICSEDFLFRAADTTDIMLCFNIEVGLITEV